MTTTRVDTEITGALEWLLRRPIRVAQIMAGWPGTVDLLTDVLRGCEQICAANDVRVKDFGRRFDPTVSFDAHQRYLIIELNKT